MARGTEIIVSSNPKGQFLEGIISGTPKPGSLMQVKAAVAKVGGRFTYEVLAPAGGDGKPSECLVLLPDSLQGKLDTDAYVSGRRGFLYAPLPGEEMNVLVGEVAGTGNTFAIGDLFMADAEDGILIPASTPTLALFKCLETVTQASGSNLTWCMKI